ncbi:uncharacterized protein LOC134204041 isoform X2 [Armigeres subalbatus]|uniref:uncharacterized protein LOC134204041 isoform X2 n=1 Tax=Armigeres subalbatus TaxID=124917 RepID=UPI002ECFC01A
MNLSHFLEKLKIGKRYVLLDVVVQPDCEQPWESAGPENKFIPTEVWKMIYRKLEGICRKQFDERGRSKGSKCDLDKEYKCRLDDKPTYLLKYQFKDENTRTILNVVFNDNDKKLHDECLVVEIVDETKNLFRELEEKKKTIEQLQKENEKLKELPALSQEYTPAPVKKSTSSGASLEYIPTAINGESPINSSSYKARKIESTVKPEPDPYTPTSSQEHNPDKIAYVPRSLSTPLKSESDVRAPGSVESTIVGKRRKRQKAIFGSEDEDEVNLSPIIIKDESSLNRSDEDMFSSEPSQPVVCPSSDDLPDSNSCTRKQLPRKTKARMMSPEKTPPPSTSSLTKRRRREDVSAAKDSSSKGTLDGWMRKLDSKKDESLPSSSKDKSNKDRSRKTKKDGEEKFVAAPIHVDRDKLRQDAENMRKTIAALDQLDKLYPEDKTLLDIPVLNCHEMSADEINATFVDYREELKEIYDEHKDKSERELLETSLCNWQEVTSVLSDQQTYVMISRLEQFNSAEQSGMVKLLHGILSINPSHGVGASHLDEKVRLHRS